MAYRQKEYNYNDKLTKDQNFLMDKLYKMRMSGMAEAFENQLMNPNSGLESFETRFSEIINHEWSGRENKKFNRLLKQATLKYPAADIDSSLYDPERQLTHMSLNYWPKVIGSMNRTIFWLQVGQELAKHMLHVHFVSQHYIKWGLLNISVRIICFKNPPMRIVKIITMSIQTRWPVMIFLL